MSASSAGWRAKIEAMSASADSGAVFCGSTKAAF